MVEGSTGCASTAKTKMRRQEVDLFFCFFFSKQNGSFL